MRFWRTQRHDRSMDLDLLTLFAARERTLKKWKEIFCGGDHTLEVKCKNSASGPPSDILDIVWNGEKEVASEGIRMCTRFTITRRGKGSLQVEHIGLHHDYSFSRACSIYLLALDQNEGDVLEYLRHSS